MIRALFDTLAMPQEGSGYRYGSPEQNMHMAFQSEIKNPAKAVSFRTLRTKLVTLSQELHSLQLHGQHRDRIASMITEIQVYCDAA